MSHARYLVGDVFDRMARLEDGSVDLVLTSPPFLALRSYLPADHPDKGKEIGSEATPAAFLDTLLALTAEWRRLLAPHGSICVELGDTYSGSATAEMTAHDRPQDGGYSSADRVKGEGHKAGIRNMNDKRQGGGAGWPLAKSLCGIPHLYHLSLAYGRNLLTGEPSPAGQWRVRNVVAWCRPNPPVGALGDKFRPGTSYMTVACVSGSRYFDLDAVRSAHTEPGADRQHGQRKSPAGGGDAALNGSASGQNPAGAPPLDWWEIPTQPSSEAETGRLLRVPLGAGGDGIRRTTSPSCPQHGSTDPQGSRVPGGGHEAGSSNRNGRNGGRLAPVQPPGSVPTQLTIGQTDDSPPSSAEGSPAATPHSKPSRRTAPAPATAPAGTPSGRSPAHTDDTPAEPESSSPHPDTPSSNTAEACPPAAEPGTQHRIAGMSDPSSACTCSYYVETLIPQDTSDYAGWPADYWVIPTQGYKGAHYATWPTALCTRPILSMCPQRVCTVCGQPSRRITEAEYIPTQATNNTTGRGVTTGVNAPGADPSWSQGRANKAVTTLGWSDCGHDQWRNGLVLDPFAGSGTTLAVATGHGRDAIGIDLDARNADLAAERVGMFLKTDYGEVVA